MQKQHKLKSQESIVLPNNSDAVSAHEHATRRKSACKQHSKADKQKLYTRSEPMPSQALADETSQGKIVLVGQRCLLILRKFMRQRMPK